MKTVLLIDDDLALRELLKELLSAGGWNVLEADDGEMGLKLALEHKPSVVVCDLLMPRSNGFQFCRALNARRSELPETKIVVSSGSGYAVDRINALESGADEYVTKPIHADALLGLLERLSGGGGPEEKAEDGRKTTPAGESGGLVIPHGVTKLKFWGVRGSIPAPGPDTVYYGGNTSCVEVRADGELIILDAGTGIRQLGHALKKECGDRPIRMTVLISHTHWDHIQGFPFFAPAYDPKNKVRILAFEGPRKGVEATLSTQMESPYFPISMEEMPGNIQFEELKTMEFDLGSVHIKAAFMNHPGVCVGYRIHTSAGSICYFPDNELYGKYREARKPQSSGETQIFARNQDEKLREFIAGADVVISDAQYDATEYPQHIGWGHSCAEDVVEFGIRSGIKQLFLFHHDPDHTDAHIAQMLAGARQRVSEANSQMQVEAAREGLEVVLKKG
jgi:phosphoribosyl 1,2-cyclic phosphodiesterase/ActR/RegA family two-component response regulator